MWMAISAVNSPIFSEPQELQRMVLTMAELRGSAVRCPTPRCDVHHKSLQQQCGTACFASSNKRTGRASLYPAVTHEEAVITLDKAFSPESRAASFSGVNRARPPRDSPEDCSRLLLWLFIAKQRIQGRLGADNFKLVRPAYFSNSLRSYELTMSDLPLAVGVVR